MEAALRLETSNLTQNVENFAVDQIRQWFLLCDKFLDWQQENLLKKEPTPEKLEEHRQALKWMLRFMRLMHCEVADPEFSDHSVIRGLETRLKQLESSWSMFHDRSMTDAQADAVLAQVFPE